jgi:hypothetical protein
VMITMVLLTPSLLDPKVIVWCHNGKLDTYGGYEITSKKSRLVPETLNIDSLPRMLVLVSSGSYHD